MVFGPTAGPTLADKLAHHRKGKPKDVPRPPTDRELIEALTKRVEALEAMRPDVSIPQFLQDAPPHEVAELLADHGLTPGDTYERVNESLVAALTKAKSSAELARGYGGIFDGKSVVEWERKAQAINESIRWNSGRKVETI